MVSDEHYDLCLPILQDPSLEDEDKTDKLEDLFKEKTNLSGASLENAILDAMWRYREGGVTSSSPVPIRQNILRRPSPAPWRGSGTPISGSPRLGVSPLAPPGFVSSSFNRTKSSTASPFTSPRASPRAALATPAIPHSPSLHAYEFSNDATPAIEIMGDFPTENVEWLVNDDAVSVTSSIGTPSGLNAAAPEFSSNMTTQQIDMSPFDMLRSILGPMRTDEEIEAALEQHGFNLSAAMTAIMESPAQEGGGVPLSPEEPKNILVGKSVAVDGPPATPVGQQKSGVICKFYMSTGQCLRADCRFSHDLSNHICKYWVMGNCLAGDTCIFSHDPAMLANKLTLDDAGTPPTRHAALQLHDASSFPSLQAGGMDGMSSSPSVGTGMTTPPGLRPMHGSDSPRARSRPGSRHQMKEASISAPALDDNEAFPSLGSASAKQGKKHHGKRGGHGHTNVKENNPTPSSLADIVKMSPSPAPSSPRSDAKKNGRNGNSSAVANGENSAAARAIPCPKQIPWLETGELANKAYLKARQEAIKHGGLRNKFLQSAAQAWNRNDARAAKALSLRGQSENDLMRKAHREAAQELYEARNKQKAVGDDLEIFVDLHGLHPDEAVEYLEKILLDNSKDTRPVFAITGTGHHSKSGKDKVGKAVRNFLNEWRYAYREFSVPGDRNNMGGILGIDPRSWDRNLERKPAEDEQATRVDILSQGIEIGEGKVKLLVRDPPKGPSRR